MKIYRMMSLTLAVVFAIVGLLFLFAPDGVLAFFNTLSRGLGMREAPLTGMGFFLILAVGYMALVTVIAGLMFLRPKNRYFPLLLTVGKLASAELSFYMFIVHQPYLICLVNGIVDGAIGALALIFVFRLKKQTA